MDSTTNHLVAPDLALLKEHCQLHVPEGGIYGKRLQVNRGAAVLSIMIVHFTAFFFSTETEAVLFH